MNKFKIVIMLGFCLLIMTSVTCTSVLAKEDVSSDNYNDIICQQVSELIGVPEESIQTVKLQNSTTESIFKFKEDNENDRALEVVSERNGVIEKKLIFPKIVIDGELINSFDYAEMLWENSNDEYGIMPTDAHIPITNLVDTTLNISCYYSSWKINLAAPLVYTPKSVYFSWTSNNSSVYINDVDVFFFAIGEYYCKNPYGSLGYDKRVDFEVYKVRPDKGVSYGDWAQAMDDNYGLMCTHYLDHTGAVGYSINYTVNGTTRYDRSSQTVFSK